MFYLFVATGWCLDSLRHDGNGMAFLLSHFLHCRFVHVVCFLHIFKTSYEVMQEFTLCSGFKMVCFVSGWRVHGHVQHDEWNDGEHGEYGVMVSFLDDVDLMFL